MSTLERAIQIATEAHHGQVDKAGNDYILHPLRVMELGNSLEEKIVGVLHDVVEDTNWTFERLADEGFSPIILDADALNILANNKTWLPLVPKHSILTPHPKEMERLIGHCANGYERLIRAQELAERMQVNIILKGAWTAVITSDGVCRFNPTGNPGMGTAGSGDVLTGVLLALMAQGYSPENAAIIGTYIHGAAGDLAAEEKGENGMIASDIIEKLPLVWKQLKKNDYLCSNKELKCY